MRVMQLTTAGGWGGREMYPPELAAALGKRGHQVSVIAKIGTPLAGRLEETGQEHDLLRAGPYLDPPAAWKLAQIIKQRRPEVIHIHLSRDLALVEMACGLAGCHPALILHKHIASAGNKRDLLHRKLYNRLSAVIAVSEFVRKSLLASCPVREDQVRVIYFGLDPDKYDKTRCSWERHCELREEFKAGEMGEKVLVGVVGRLDPRKGQEVFLRAAAIALEMDPLLRFVVVGAPEGDYDRTLHALAAGLGIEDNVVFTGFRTDILDILFALDILVVPSLEEAFGFTALEGMFAGLPVIAAQAGALPEFVIHQDTGLLVPPSDPHALARMIIRVSASLERRFELGEYARAWATEHLSWERHLEQIEDLYRECLARPPEGEVRPGE
jgi:glycosyltransferase involved in cell wall biosynthesis